MKKIFAIAIIGLLSACNATPEEQQFDLERVKEKLPEGCEIHYAGKVRTVDSQRESRVFYTKCGNVVTTSATETVPGKASYAKTTATVHIDE